MIYFYTRSQKTRVCAEALSDILGLPLYELQADINRYGRIRFIFSAMASVMTRKGTPINNLPIFVPPEIYLCGPVWAGHPAGPLAYFLRNVDLSGTQVHLLLSAAQPTEKDRETAQGILANAGCQAGEVYLLATAKGLPERDTVAEHLREMLP